MIKLRYIYKEKLAFGTWQFSKIGVLVNFIIKDWRFCKIAKLLLCFSFSGQRKFGRIVKKKSFLNPALVPISV